MSSQAVGNAIHHNPIPIIVPCHRVIGCHHNLVGYGLGMKLKIKFMKQLLPVMLILLSRKLVVQSVILNRLL